MIETKFNSIPELLQHFSTEQVCIEYLENLRWGGEVISPFHETSKVYHCKDNLYRCKNTGKYFNAKTGTFLEKTAWFMAQRIRGCFGIENYNELENGIVECDETFIGGNNKNRHWNKKVKNSQGRSFKKKKTRIEFLGLF